MQPLHGLLDMLVLRTLVMGPLHGYGIAKAIKTASTDELDIEFGSLYPALKRLEIKGWISWNWEETDTGRRVKCYRLTPAGKKKLTQEHAEWHVFASAVARIMGSPSKTRP